MSIDVNLITEGFYYYTMPHWANSKIVQVIKVGNELKVVFIKGYYPTSVKDLPETATLIKIDKNV